MKQYLRSYDGKKCPIDLENPLVMIKGKDFGEDYKRGSLVYPIGNRGEKPGSHFGDGWMTVSTLNTNAAEFCGVEIGKGAIPLKELLEVYGRPLGISYEGRNFKRENKQISHESAIVEMLEYYVTMQLPEEVRDLEILSRATHFKPTDCESGIIFDSLDELAYGLKVYGSDLIRASKATEDQFYKDTWRSDHPNTGADDPNVFRQTPKAFFLQQALELINKGRGSLVDKIIAEIFTSNGRYRGSFDYDAMGTPFFKTSINVDQIDDKFVLGISAAYIGDEPEVELAKTLNKERGLVSIGSMHELKSIVQDWVGVDVDKVFRCGELSAEQIATLTKLSAGEMKLYKDYVIEIDGMPLKMALGVRQEENYDSEIIRARGNKLFMKLKGEGKPYFLLNLRQHGKDKIVNSEEKIRMIKIRDELSELVQKNLF